MKLTIAPALHHPHHLTQIVPIISPTFPPNISRISGVLAVEIAGPESKVRRPPSSCPRLALLHPIDNSNNLGSTVAARTDLPNMLDCSYRGCRQLETGSGRDIVASDRVRPARHRSAALSFCPTRCPSIQTARWTAGRSPWARRSLRTVSLGRGQGGAGSLLDGRREGGGSYCTSPLGERGGRACCPSLAFAD